MEMSAPSSRFKHPWKLSFAGLSVVVAIALAVRWWIGPSVAVETVVRRDFVQSVVASGHVESPHRVDVGAQITGTVLRVPVIEGQVVGAGDLLVELESTELTAASHQADIAIAQAQARLRQLRETLIYSLQQTLREAQANLDNAQATQRRNQELFQKGFIGQAALDDARKTVQLADAQVRSTRMQLDTTRPAGSDRALALADVASAQASAEVARARARYAMITAPVSGTLIGRDVEVGDVVQPGKLLMTLSPQGGLQLVVQIDEKNLHLLAIGQQAWGSADAYSDQRFAAELVYINPGVNAQTGAVEVKLDVPSKPLILKQDMTVSVDVEVARRPKTLLVTEGVVHDADTAAPWVLIAQDGHAVRRNVRLGLRSGGFAEVLDGLHENDPVIPVALAINPGARIRAAAPAH